MIPVYCGQQAQEAARLYDGLCASGISAKLIDSLESGVDASDEIALVPAADVARARSVLNVSRIIAFGGADKAENAVRTLQQGAAEYLPLGAGPQKVSASIHPAANEYRSQAGKVEQPILANPVASEAMQEIMNLAQRVAQADIAVMISGESGTGKEVMARQIHAWSPRAKGPFIAVNCAAIPETMLEAVLFGHDKGAFTGAAEKRLGKFELADGGTLLLDEITEMPISLQAKLLRVLQEKEVERIGSPKPTKVDVRVLATSNRQLRKAVTDGVLREDLFYRLSVFPLHIPPLRDREEDVLPLVQTFLDKYAPEQDLSLTLEAQQLLVAHQWPGNVRELENSIQRALVLNTSGVLGPADFALENTSSNCQTEQVEQTTGATSSSLQEQLRDSQTQLLLETLKACGGVRKDMAAQLGISERTLRYKLKALRDRGLLN
ncbi:MAG: sigma-54 dependent transcriptional regulator [Pseudomonadaceae bacterium]|nr:sigma-54 dependent transcriptional regulator [Pseudomonadaceae bacterium]